MFGWFKQNKAEKVKQEEFVLNFRFSFPTKGGNMETGDMKISIPARNKEEAKEKLQKFARANVRVIVSDIQKNQNRSEADTERIKRYWADLKKEYDEMNSKFK